MLYAAIEASQVPPPVIDDTKASTKFIKSPAPVYNLAIYHLPRIFSYRTARHISLRRIYITPAGFRAVTAATYHFISFTGGDIARVYVLR
jgi:hypothetical protein